MNQILYNTSKTSDKKKIIVVMLVIAIICILICLSTVFAITNKESEKIINNVYVSGIDISNMSKEEAINQIQNNYQTSKTDSIELVLNDKKYYVSANDLGYAPNNIEAIVDEAYNYGRSNNLISDNYTILFSNFNKKEYNLEYGLSDEAYSNIISKIADSNSSLSVDDSYEISGDSVIIRKGQDGIKIDADVLKEYILTAFSNGIAEVDVPVTESASKRVDLNEIYSKVYVAPQDATYVSGEKFDVIVDKTGIDFDLRKVQEDYDLLEDSGELLIHLRQIEPKVKLADLDSILFKDVLSTFSTTYDQTEKNRVQNLNVASERCNSTIVYPGKEFSFHKTIGTRTVANGYASAHSYAGGKVVNSVGGGICQISSTLYNIVLKADLEIVERKAHGMPVAYAEPSLDATIAEGSIDFRFKNNKNYPIKIVSEVKNGTVTMSLLGIKEETGTTIEIESVKLETINYTTTKQNDSTMYVGTSKVIQEPTNGCYSEAYRIEKDSNGNVISRTLISKDKYYPINEIIKVGTKQKQVTPPPTSEVPTEPNEPTTPVIPEEPERDLPPGWDSPESPYGNQ